MPSDSLPSLSLEQQIGQFFFIGLPGTELDAETRALVQEVQPGGVIIFGRNVAAPQVPVPLQHVAVAATTPGTARIWVAPSCVNSAIPARVSNRVAVTEVRIVTT